MNYEDLSIDELLADAHAMMGDTPAEEQAEMPEAEAEEAETIEKPKKKKKKKKSPEKPSLWRRFFRFLGRFFLFLLVTVLLLAVGLYGVMYVVARGPSTTARDLFVMSVRETSAVGFLANIFFTDEEIAQIESKQEVAEYVETDTSLIQIPKETEQTGDQDDTSQTPAADDWGLVDEDGDGIIIEEVKGEGYSGYMMVVLDPSRVIMGSVPTSYGGRGYTVEEMVGVFDAVAGINAGGFYDPDGRGNGSIPDTMVVYDGVVYYEGSGTNGGFVGFDSNYIMHVASTITAAQIQEQDIQYGVCFGPVLVANGEACTVNSSGVNPRTAIGQRSDGAVLMLVIDGRQVISMGATYQDLIDIMLDYGAVNACNLDGGSSSLMWYDGDYVNNCASVIGIRPVPTTFLVLKEGVSGNG